MKIAIISDIHDQINNLTWAIEKINATGDIEHTFVLGDFCSPFIVEKLLEIKTPINAVWGNNDGDKQANLEVAAKHKYPFLFSATDFDDVLLDDKTYFITHYPHLAENAAFSGKYDAVFHGHTHARREERVNNTPVINPGKLSTYPNDEFSFTIYNTKNKSIEFILK